MTRLLLAALLLAGCGTKEPVKIAEPEPSKPEFNNVLIEADGSRTGGIAKICITLPATPDECSGPPLIVPVINGRIEEYALFHTQFLDYKDALQATNPIAHFESKEEALRAGHRFRVGLCAVW